MREPEIKLFGTKIQLPENAGEVTGDESSGGSNDQEQSLQVEEVQFPVETKPQENDRNPSETEESPNQNQPSQESDDVASPEIPEPETDPQKTLKKPDKILPCPRCSSKDTKFCYYNNYNVNQPRHFCRSCQRYWTAGGTMRNVPVGSGRRKNNKTSPSYSNGFLHHATVLSFGPDCESVASIPEKKKTVKNGCHYEAKTDDYCCSSNGVVENGLLQPPPWSPYHVPMLYPYWVPNSWNVIPPCSSAPNRNSPPGKRSRDGEKKVLEASIVVPKTLRIDDPEEAAKSSIWETLGIEYDSSAQRGGLFKALQPEKKTIVAASNSSLLRANPAALSRSVTFQEGA